MKKLITILFTLAIFASVFAQNSFAQLNGTYSIPSANYPTIKVAVDSLNLYGVNGAVVFNVAAGHTETSANITLTNTTPSATWTVTFQKSGGSPNPIIYAAAGSSTTVDGIIKIGGTDYVTFDGIDLLDNQIGTQTTKMEFGYAILKASATDGSQNITIKNCKIGLRDTMTTYAIYSANHLTSSTTGLTVTAFTGTNSNENIYSNTIDSAYIGIYFAGYSAASPYDYYDHFNQVGLLGGNTISKYGAQYTNTGTAYGIYGIYQDSLKISKNNITGAQASTVTSGTFYGIFMSTGTNSCVDIDSNTISMTAYSLTSDLHIINCAMGSTGTTNTVNIRDNSVPNITRTGITSGITYFISTPGAFNLNVSGNKFTSANIGSGSSTATGTVYLIYMVSGNSNSGSVFNIAYNKFSNITRTQSAYGSGTFYGFYLSSVAQTVNIYGDTLYNLNVPSTGTAAFVYCTVPTNLVTLNIYGNQFRKMLRPNNLFTGTVTSGGIYGIYGSMVSTLTTYNAYNNVFDSVYNYYKGQVNIMYNTSGNASMATNIYGNTISHISNVNAAIFGIYSASGFTNQIYNNKLYDFRSRRDSASVYAFCLGTTTASATTYLYNNYASDLNSDSGSYYLSAAIYQFGSTAGTTYNVFYNTVFLNNIPAAGKNPQFEGIYSNTTPTLDLRNNIVVQKSVSPSGYTLLLHRNTTNLATYSSNSNNNCLYLMGGTGVRYYYFDGTNSDATFGAFQTRVSTRDNNSVSEIPPFIDTTAKPYNLHINTTIPTQVESKGIRITSPVAITKDYDADWRWGEPSYTGSGTAVDIGADEFNGISADLTAPIITYTPLPNTTSTADPTITATIVDPGSGVQFTTGSAPRIYFKKKSEANDYIGNTSFDNGWKFVETVTGSSPADFTTDFSLLTSSVGVGDTIQYFIVAQDLAAIPVVGINSGTFTSPPTSVDLVTGNFPLTGTINEYIIANAPLAGNYTVGLTMFNGLTGKNITFEKVVKKVMKEIDVEVPVTDKKTVTKKGETISDNADNLASQVKYKKQSVEVEEISWIPMENGKPYKGNLYVKKSEHPEYNYPDNVNGIYATITAAISDLNVRGVSAATAFLLNDVSYTTGETFPIVVNINSIYPTTAANRVSIKPNTGVTTLIQGTSASSQIFRVYNTSYFTIDGSNNGTDSRNMTIENNSATSPQVVFFSSTGTNTMKEDSLKNCIIIDGAQTSSAVVMQDIGGGAGYFKNIYIQNNVIKKAYIGIYALSTVASGNGRIYVRNNVLTSTGADAIRLVGIYGQGLDSAVFSGNQIANLESATAESDRGIWFATGSTNCTISGNTIDSMICSAAGYPVGIYLSSAVSNANINVTGNTVYGFSTSGGGTSVAGIQVSGATGGVTVQKNKIFDIQNTNTGGWAAAGIYLTSTLTAANVSVFNNVIYDIRSYGSDGSYLNYNGYGIWISTGGGYNIDYNSVNCYTNQTSASGRPACINISTSIVTANSVNLRNNNFVITSTSGAGRYAIICNAANTIFNSINYNNYYSTSVLGYIVSDRANLAAWITGTTRDTNSKAVDPVFGSPTDLRLSPSSTLLSAGIPISGIAYDYLDSLRNVTTPTIGAYEVGLDGSGPTISYTTLGNTTSTSNATLSGVTITDYSGVDVSANKPRIYFKKSWHSNTFGANNSATNGWKWKEFTTATTYDFEIDYSLLYDVGTVVPGDIIQYFVVAQDLAGTPNTGAQPSTGFTATSVSNITSAPTTPNSYQINSAVPLSGTYTVGLGTYNQLSDKNLYYKKETRKVERIIKVEVPSSEKSVSKSDVLARENMDLTEKGKTEINNINNNVAEIRKADNTEYKFEKRIVTEDYYTLMDNDKPFEGPMYIANTNRNQNSGKSRGDNPDVVGAYLTLSSAIGDLTVAGMTGPVIFSLIDDTYSGESYPITISAITGQSSTNTLTIKPASGKTPVFSGYSASSVITLNGARYVTIEGSNNGTTSRDITFTNTNVSASTAALFIKSLGAGLGSACDTVRNCNLYAGSNSTTTTYGIYIGGTTIGSTGADNDSLAIINNSVNKANYGIYVAGITSTVNDNLSIISNDIGGMNNVSNRITQYGMYLTYCNNSSISKNHVRNVYQPTAGSPWYNYGMYVSTGFVNSTIDKNIIDSINYSGLDGGSARGMYVSTGSASSNLTIANNVIFNLLADGYSGWTVGGGLAGIMIDGSTGGVGVYNNSINLTTQLTYATGVTSADIYFGASVTAITMRNNIFANSVTNPSQPTSKAWNVYDAGTSGIFADINYNDYYPNSGSQGFVGYLSADKLTLDLWKTATGKDLNSYSGNPAFTSPTNLLPDNTSSNAWNIYGKGMPLSVVTDDILGTARSTTTAGGPTCMGAYEIVINPGSNPPPVAAQTGSIGSGSTSYYGQSSDSVMTITWGAALDNLNSKVKGNDLKSKSGDSQSKSGTGNLDFSPNTLPTTVNVQKFSGVTPPDTATGIAKKIGKGYWYVDADVEPANPVNVKIYWGNQELGSINDTSQLVLAMYDLRNRVWVPFERGFSGDGFSIMDNANKTITVNGLPRIDSVVFALTAFDAPVKRFKFALTAIINGFYHDNGTGTFVMKPDSILVVVRDTVGPAYTALDTIRMFQSDSLGHCSGFTSLANTGGYGYYLQVIHMNSLDTWTPSGPLGQMFSAVLGTMVYDFTSAQTQAYGSNMVLGGDGLKYCIINGDCNRDNYIDGSDYVEVVNNYLLAGSFLIGDTNGDDYIDGSDYLPIGNSYLAESKHPLPISLRTARKSTEIKIRVNKKTANNKNLNNAKQQ